jgi:hypothetical protein
MRNYSEEELIRFFEDAGYNNVEIISDRIIFTTGEEVNNWTIEQAIEFINFYFPNYNNNKRSG